MLKHRPTDRYAPPPPLPPDAPPPDDPLPDAPPPDDTSAPSPLVTPLIHEPIPNSRTLPPPGTSGLQEPTRPTRDRRPVDHLQMDLLGGYATLGMAAMYSAAEGAGFDASSHRMPSEALFVATENGAERLVSRTVQGLASRPDGRKTGFAYLKSVQKQLNHTKVEGLEGCLPPKIRF